MKKKTPTKAEIRKSKPIKLIQGDCLDKLKELESDSVDSIVTDPPYGLSFMGKAWDNAVPSVEVWKESIRVLKPGGYILAFAGTRTYHRMAVAIEDAGFEVRDMIEWVYGSGFPKSHNIGKAVDKLQGSEREETHKETKANSTYYTQNVGETIVNTSTYSVTKGNSPYEGWGTALKPAHEPICMARKPLSEKTVAKNCLKWGTGGINIDESRVGFEKESESFGKKVNDYGEKAGGQWQKGKQKRSVPPEQGRFPANLCHDNGEEVRECFSNESERFFKSIIYQAKASKAERNKGCEGLEKGCSHPTVKPIALMEYLIKMVTPKGGTVLDPFMGSGSTGVACKENDFGFVGIDLEPEYIEIAKARINSVNK